MKNSFICFPTQLYAMHTVTVSTDRPKKAIGEQNSRARILTLTEPLSSYGQHTVFIYVWQCGTYPAPSSQLHSSPWFLGSPLPDQSLFLLCLPQQDGQALLFSFLTQSQTSKLCPQCLKQTSGSSECRQAFPWPYADMSSNTHSV